jgi:FAD/FMN-containing dehydrogenase
VQDIVAELVGLLGRDAVLDRETVRGRARHPWDPTPIDALALVRPRTTDEVSAILRLCHARGQPVVTIGGATGLAGGHRATPADLILSLERMNRIEEVDAVGRTAIVQAGCPLQVLQEAAEREGLLFPLDLGARGSCTVGGNVATNAGGITVIRYGMMRALVLGLEAVLADGTIVSSMNRMLKNNTGYDLKQLFIGTEGTLGVVTRVVVALKEAPTSVNTALVALEEIGHVAALLKHADRRLGGQLSSFEVMWGEFYRAVTGPGWQTAPLDRDYPYYVILESQGADARRDEQLFQAALEEAVEAGLIVDAAMPKSRAERDRFWAIREDLGPITRDRPLIAYDVSLPIRDMPAYVAEVEGRLAALWPEGRVYVFGHIGDGNLHLVVCPRTAVSDPHALADPAVYEPLAQYGGAVSAEHGIGLDKKRWMPVTRSDAEIALMRLLKRSLDPRGILNPGKVVDAAG